MTAPLLLSRDEINDIRWNELIDKSRQQIIYGYSWYLDVVSDNWKALIWPSVEDYKVVMPLPVRRKWMVEVVEQPLFCQYLGIFSLDYLSEILTNEFLKALAQNFVYISSYHFNPTNTEILRYSISNSPVFHFTENTTFWLPLSFSYENIFMGYSADRRLNIKRSLLQKWSVRNSRDITPLIELFRRNHESKIGGGVREGAYEILRKLLEEILKFQSAELLYALKEDVIHAGVLIVKSECTAVYLFNASDEVGRKGNARTFLLDEFFKNNSELPLTFDFESPEVTSIAKFYQSFGARPTHYLAIKKNSLPFPFRQIQNWRLNRLLNTTQVPSEDF